MVIVPDSWVPSNTNGFLWITGGSVTDGKPQVTDEDIEVSAALATGTGCITGMFVIAFRIRVGSMYIHGLNYVDRGSLPGPQ